MTMIDNHDTYNTILYYASHFLVGITCIDMSRKNERRGEPSLRLPDGMESYQHSLPQASYHVDEDAPIEVEGHGGRRRLCYSLKFAVGVSIGVALVAVARLAARADGSSYTKAIHLTSTMLETNVFAPSNTPFYARRVKKHSKHQKQKHRTSNSDKDDNSTNAHQMGKGEQRPTTGKEHNDSASAEQTNEQTQEHSHTLTRESKNNQTVSNQENSDDKHQHYHSSTAQTTHEPGQRHHHHKHVDVHVVVDDDDNSFSPNATPQQSHENSSDSSSQNLSNSNFQQYKGSETASDWQKCVDSKDPDCWRRAYGKQNPVPSFAPTEANNNRPTRIPTLSPDDFDWKEYAIRLQYGLQKCMHSNDPVCWKRVFAGDGKLPSPLPTHKGTSPPTVVSTSPSLSSAPKETSLSTELPSPIPTFSETSAPTILPTLISLLPTHAATASPSPPPPTNRGASPPTVLPPSPTHVATALPSSFLTHKGTYHPTVLQSSPSRPPTHVEKASPSSLSTHKLAFYPTVVPTLSPSSMTRKETSSPTVVPTKPNNATTIGPASVSVT